MDDKRRRSSSKAVVEPSSDPLNTLNSNSGAIAHQFINKTCAAVQEQIVKQSPSRSINNNRPEIKVTSSEAFFNKSLTVTRASFYPKETTSNFYALQSRLQKENSHDDSLVNVRLDETWN